MKKILISCGIGIILLAFLASAPASAFFFDDDGDDDASIWQPPERNAGMDLADEEYVDLWGEISLYDTDSTEYNQTMNTFGPRTGDAGNIQVREMTDGLTPNPTPRDHVVEWNTNVHQSNIISINDAELPDEKDHVEPLGVFRNAETGKLYVFEHRYENFSVNGEHKWDFRLWEKDSYDAHTTPDSHREKYPYDWVYDGPRADSHSNAQIVVSWQELQSSKWQYIKVDESEMKHIETPPGDNAVDGDRVIYATHINIISVEPHTYYHKPFENITTYKESGENPTSNTQKYITQDPTLPIVANHEIDSTDDKYKGEDIGRERWLYTITDQNTYGSVTARNITNGRNSISDQLDYDLPEEIEKEIRSSGVDKDLRDQILNETGVNITKQNITSNVVDHKSISGDSTTVDLDLTDLSEGDEVKFIARKNVTATEEEDYDKKICNDWESDGDGGSTCTDSEWDDRNTTYYNDSVDVKYIQNESAKIYDPNVNVTYSATETRGGEYYQLDVKNTQPIAGVAPTGDIQTRYPVKMFSFSDPEYRNALADVSPVEHHTLPADNVVTANRDGAVEIRSDRGDVNFYRPPENVNVNIDGTTVREISQTRISGTTRNFNPHNIEITPILPTDDIDPNLEPGDPYEFSNLNLIATYQTGQWNSNQTPDRPSHGDHDFKSGYGDKTFTVSAYLRDRQTGNYISTSEYDNMHIRFTHGGTGETKTFNTSENSEYKFNVPIKDVEEYKADPLIFELVDNGTTKKRTEMKITQFELDYRRSESDEDENKLNVIPTKLQSRYTTHNELENQTAKIYNIHLDLATTTTSNPIITEGNSNLRIKLINEEDGTEKTLNTDLRGETNTTIKAYHGDRITAELIVDDQDGDSVILESMDTFTIQNDIDASESIMNILTGIVMFFFKILLAPLIALSLITKGLTGDWHPF